MFERYVTLPVGTWLIALEQSSRSQCGRLLRTLQSHYFVLREKKETFSVASLQLTVQLPCGNVFSSFILPLRACQRRSVRAEKRDRDAEIEKETFLCISISLLRPYTLFSRSPLVNKTLFENACELE